ncbi:MAG: DUF4102 domain-containing protein [Arcobacter sp.]|nr:DUF4102 domain-containing protein [Arcobacter sp.]
MTKISKPLTTTEVKSYKPQSKMYKKPDGKGLWLLIKPNGTKSWRYDFRYGGKNLSISFSIYPEIGLKKAS